MTEKEYPPSLDPKDFDYEAYVKRGQRIAEGIHRRNLEDLGHPVIHITIATNGYGWTAKIGHRLFVGFKGPGRGFFVMDHGEETYFDHLPTYAEAVGLA